MQILKIIIIAALVSAAVTVAFRMYDKAQAKKALGK
jgi:type II secretory pathway pseudopilin PulG